MQKVERASTFCNMLHAEVVTRATNSRNLQCNIVVQEVARKCCPYYLAFRVVFLRILSCKFRVSRVTVLGVFLGRLNVLLFRRVFRSRLRTLTIIISLGAPKGSLRWNTLPVSQISSAKRHLKRLYICTKKLK